MIASISRACCGIFFVTFPYCIYFFHLEDKIFSYLKELHGECIGSSRHQGHAERTEIRFLKFIYLYRKLREVNKTAQSSCGFT